MMAKFDAHYVDGIFWKIVGLGAIASAIGFVALSKHFAASVLLGTVITAVNFRVIAFGARKLLAGAAEKKRSAMIWPVILGAKIIALFAFTYWSIIVLGADVVGFVIGYSVFIPALIWQTILYAHRLEAEVDEEEVSIDEADTERS
jgi:small-conductance mechanosensitive channel